MLRGRKSVREGVEGKEERDLQEDFRTDKREIFALCKKRIDRLLAMSKEYNKGQM